MYFCLLNPHPPSSHDVPSQLQTFRQSLMFFYSYKTKWLCKIFRCDNVRLPSPIPRKVFNLSNTLPPTFDCTQTLAICTFGSRNKKSNLAFSVLFLCNT